MRRFSVVLSEKVLKTFSNMDRYTKKIIFSWIENNLEGCENPRLHGKALTANLSGLWRYSIGDYRLICKIEDEILIITAVNVGHRRKIYE